MLVEEENSFITGRVGQRVRLRDPFMNGRPVLIEAMQIYKELERQKAIKLPRKESGKYILHQSIFDSEHDKKGDEFFQHQLERNNDRARSVVVMLLRNGI